jgi:cold shock CspA family protein
LSHVKDTNAALCDASSSKAGTFMETPVEIDLQGVAATAELRDAIARHLRQFEERFGRITAGRVALKTPSGHHHTGGLFEINIHLALPDGREVNVGHTRQDDERYADLSFALNHTFKRARRQLQDKARRLEGMVKAHESQPVGIVRQLDPLGEFGFIETTDGREIYFHRNSVLNGDFSRLTVNARVAFAEETGEKGPQASTVRLLRKHRLKT